MTKTPHYDDTMALLRRYRAALCNISLIGETFDENHIKELGLDIAETKAAHEAALSLKAKIDSAVLQLQVLHVQGYRLARILFYRFMDKTPRSTEEIVAELSREGYIKTKHNYEKLKSEAVNVMSHLIFGDELTYDKISNMTDSL